MATDDPSLPVPGGPTEGAAAAPAALHAPRPRRRWVIPVLAVVVAVAVVIGTLAATGELPWFHSSSPHPYAPTFDQAVGEGQPTANGVAGGPWGAALGVAVRIPIPVTLPTSNLTNAIPTGTGCNATFPSTLPKDVVVDGTAASAGPGASAFWVVLYVNSAGSAVGVLVDGGAGTEGFTLGGSSCSSVLQDLVPFPSGAPDSPAVIGAVNASGGEAYLAAHPGATEIFGGASVVVFEPLWGVLFTTCTLTPVANATGTEFNATVSGTTVLSQHSGNLSCSAPSGLSLPGLVAPVPSSPSGGKAI
jgi:hypothetical protein